MNLWYFLSETTYESGQGIGNYESMQEWLVSFLLSLFILMFVLYLLESRSSGRTIIRFQSKQDISQIKKTINDYLRQSGFKAVEEHNRSIWKKGGALKGTLVYEIEYRGKDKQILCEGNFYFKPAFPFRNLELMIFSKYMVPDWYGRKKALKITNNFISFLEKELEVDIKMEQI